MVGLFPGALFHDLGWLVPFVLATAVMGVGGSWWFLQVAGVGERRAIRPRRPPRHRREPTAR